MGESVLSRRLGSAIDEEERDLVIYEKHAGAVRFLDEENEVENDEIEAISFEVD